MAKYNKYPFWKARFWHGMRFSDWVKLAAENRFRIHLSRWPMAVTITMLSIFNSFCSLVQTCVYGSRIRRTEITNPPVFIVGHWRSGTTLLHELMVCDERFHYPNTFQCFVPHHFLVSEWWGARLFGFLVPKQRPMDNMKAGMGLPQEDEFALMNLGVPSPYRRMAFPQEAPCCLEFLNMKDIGNGQMEHWQQSLVRFAKSLTVARDARLVFKSPTHTGRLEVLTQMFPDAKFVHISRHPHSLFPSTVRLWKALDTVSGLQTIDDDAEQIEREAYVLDCFDKMYEGYDSYRGQLAETQLLEVRYEDLIERPLETLEQIYRQLNLGDFEPARASVQQYLDQRKDYTPNPHPELPSHVTEEIRNRWASYAERYRYEV